jgi:outer membrane receptor protein involved in Fe transport
MLRMEYFPLKRLRFISAFSYSDFNVPKNNYSNYQIMATYQLSFDTSLRASVQSSTSSPFMLNQYIDLEFTFPNNPSQRADVKGDKEGALSRIKTYELGMRNQLDFNNFIEFELFHSEIEDSSNYIIQPVEIIDGQSVTERNLQRLEQKAIQNGATVNWIYEELDWKVNAFLTWQNTEVEDQLESLFVGAETQDRHKKATPRYYGGLNLDWQLSPTVKFNILSNYLEQQTFELQAPQGTKKIPSALYTNLTLSYRYSTQIDGYLSVKNLSDQHESQHFYTDRLEPIYMLGFNIKLDGG